MKVVKMLSGAVLLITVPVIIESCTSCGFMGWNTDSKVFSIGDSMEISHSSWTVDQATTIRTYAANPTSAPLSRFLVSAMMEAHYRDASIFRATPTMAAYACSPAPPRGDQKFTEVTITSDRPLSTTAKKFAAGEALNSIFLVLEPWASDGPEMEKLIGKEVYGNELMLVSEHDVDVAQRHKFKIKIKLDDGRTLEATGPEVELTPKI